MILKGSQRGGGKQLAQHLLRMDENDHVELHSLRGFVSDDLTEAFKEAYAVSKGTKCKQFLFSVSLNPPKDVSVDIATFEAAIEQLEEKLKLDGQPRAIVFHEKDGRRHAHVVWSRIRAETMTAQNMPHFKLKLKDMSRQLYLYHGWKMPRGLVKAEARDPKNFSLAEWQAAKRRGKHAHDQRTILQDCWAISDSLASFRNALAEHGYVLAKGDRRGHVVVAHDGQVLAVTRAVGKRVKDVRAKIGEADALPSVEDAKQAIKRDLSGNFGRMARQANTKLRQRQRSLDRTRQSMIDRHRDERDRMNKGQAARWQIEAAERASRFAKGLSGIWQRVTGARARIRTKNQMEAYEALQRDRGQRQELIDLQLKERSIVEDRRAALRRRALGIVDELRQDRDRLIAMIDSPAAQKKRRRRNRRHEQSYEQLPEP